MHNIQSISKDFTVNEVTGEATISNRKLGELIGVPESSLRRYFGALNIVITQGVTSQNASKAAHHFATKGNTEAQSFLDKIGDAGMKAFIYHEAVSTMSGSNTLARMLVFVSWSFVSSCGSNRNLPNEGLSAIF